MAQAAVLVNLWVKLEARAGKGYMRNGGKWYQTALALNPVGHEITAVGRLEFEAEAGNAKEKSVFLPPFALGQLGGASAPQPPSERSSTFGGGFRLFSARRPPQRPIIGWLHA